MNELVGGLSSDELQTLTGLLDKILRAHGAAASCPAQEK